MITKKNPVYLTVLLVALAIVITFQVTVISTGGYGNLFGGNDPVDTQAQNNGNSVVENGESFPLDDETIRKLKEIAAMYASIFPGDTDPELIEEYMIQAMIAGMGDTFGNYVSAEDYDSYLSSIAGNFKGIGVSVIYDSGSGAMEVVSVFPDSPAEKAGVLCGDIVAYVGIGEQKQSVVELGYYKAIELIRGEDGTMAEFVVIRGGELIEFSVERGEVTNQTVTMHMYESDSRVAVIRINQFEVVTLDQFMDAMVQAQRAGAEAYVFDVRSNPGGELNTIVSILDMLLPEGPIIRIQYKDPQYNTQLNSDAACIKAPMVVLCNGSTASAGELFCSALQDYGVAKLVGTQTYGKGTMQRLYKLSDGSGLSMTVAYYLPPTSDNYHGVGVTPDIVCDISEELKGVNLHKYTDKNDNQLAEAVAALGLEPRN